MTRPPLFAVLAFWAFVIGGLGFGGIFVANWRALGERPDSIPPIQVAAGPVTVKVPVVIPAP